MMYRALLVLLVVINVGVVAWWASRTPPPRETPIEMPADVPRLQLLEEVPAARRPKAAVAVAAPVAPTQCISFGPFENPVALRRAHELLVPRVAIARVREVPLGKPTGWRVYIPALASMEAAQAMADRILAAGLDDLFVMPSGPDRNGIALGRFGNEEAARRRLAQVEAAGFKAQVAPLGDVRVEGWIDAGASAAFDPARAAQDIAAAQARPLDCATLR
jgi:cell division septation protein DedD